MTTEALKITCAENTNNTLQIKCVVAFVFVVCACMGLCFQYPFNALPNTTPFILAFFRIVFFGLVVCRLWFGRHAAALLWGHQSVSYLKAIGCLWLLVAIAGCLGIGGAYSHYLNAILFFIVFYRSKYYSIEDIYYQLASFVVIFLPTTQVWSLDSLLGWGGNVGAVFGADITLLALNVYAWLLALMLLSAATEKALTANWRKGLSFYYFVALPHLTLPYWRWLKNHKLLCQFSSWMTVIGQGTLFVGYFIPALLPLLWLKQCAFGFLLICIVDLSFIGQLFVAQFVLFFLITLGSLTGSASYVPASTPLLGVGMAALFIVFAAIRSFFLELKGYHQWMPKWCDQSVRILSGSCPVKVFSDAHLFGLYIYQVVDDTGKNVLPAFMDDGGPGPLQRWHPRYYQGAMYSVTDVCLAKRYWSEYSGSREDRLEDLLAAGFTLATGSQRLTLRVKAINPSEHYEKNTSAWLDAQWTDIYEGVRQNGKVSTQWLGLPPAVKKTARNFKR